MSKIILNNISTNSTTATFNVLKSDPEALVIQVTGTFGGAKVVLQSAIVGLDFQDMDGFSFETPSMRNVKLRNGMIFRFVISGGTGINLNIGVDGGGY